jgi:hypothetical protein
VIKFFWSKQKKTSGVKAWIAKQSTTRLYMVGTLILLAVLGFGALITALGNALFFEGYAADGAFQLLNPLRRLMDGQVLGQDFNFFHGVGVPLLHLPFYLLFGQGLFGEELTRWLVSPALFSLSAFCFFYVLRRKFTFALGMSMVVTALAMLIIPFLVLPLTSILGVRSVAPVFLLALVLNQVRLSRPIVKDARSKFIKSWTWYELSAGVLLAVSLLCGTEFGMAAILAFIIAHLAYAVRPKESFKIRLLSLSRVGASFAVSLFGILSAITLGHPFEPLKYALIDIPTDQFWYFGVPPNDYIHFNNAIVTIMTDWRILIMWGIALVAGLFAWRVHRLRKYRVETQAFIFGLLAGVFAMVSMLGYYSNSQAGALGRMGLLVGGAALFILVGHWKKPVSWGLELGRFKRRYRIQPAQAWRGLAVVFIVASLVYAAAMFAFVKKEFALGDTLRKARDYVTGVDTNLLDDKWKDVDEAIVPVVQADNSVEIVDTSDNGFEHGVSGAQLLVKAGDKSSFIRARQIVYFPKAGRQIIDRVETRGDQQLVTLQNKSVKLDPAKDGAPSKLIVAEDFKHDNTKMWSLYTGVLNEEMGIMNPSHGGYDYIIHALGPERREQYVRDFVQQQPQFVLTFTHGYFTWEGWMQNSHWEFYSLIDQNYEVVKESSTYALWKRKDQAWDNKHAQSQPWQPLAVTPGSDRIDLPKLSFDNVPDIEAYGLEQSEKDRQRMIDLGKQVDPRSSAGREVYDQYILEKLHERQDEERRNRENNGPETEALQKKASEDKWQNEAAEKNKPEKERKTNEAPLLHLPRPKRQVVLLKLQYETSSPLSFIPVLGKTTRYMVEQNNVYTSTVASLKPYTNEMILPIVISEKNNDPYIRLNTYSLLPGKGSIKILKAEWTTLDTSVQNLKILTD